MLRRVHRGEWGFPLNKKGRDGIFMCSYHWCFRYLARRLNFLEARKRGRIRLVGRLVGRAAFVQRVGGFLVNRYSIVRYI